MDRKFHIHLVSDSTGETLHAMTNAALAQFDDVDVMVHPYALVRAQAQLTRALDHIAIMPGIVFFTLANQGLRDKLMARCADIQVRCIDVLEGPVTALRQFLGRAETHKVGRQHEVDARYLDRIEALNFTIAHDDGQSLDSIQGAQVILTGASRTSKTPTCVYLAIRGIPAANVPLIPGVPAPPQLLNAKGPLIVGLWVSPDRLVQVRRNRLTSMGEDRDSNYVELDAVRAEIAATRQLFENQEWPMIDVSRRSIEETAAAVMNLLAERKEKAG
ncbi:MAG TPA: pyruvate, water dikinase regulatory protein [Rhizomicrobium sp.]|nr:pyruvate, water dikinase regulatory protein [Rhizomicrobium sp.]